MSPLPPRSSPAPPVPLLLPLPLPACLLPSLLWPVLLLTVCTLQQEHTTHRGLYSALEGASSLEHSRPGTKARNKGRVAQQHGRVARGRADNTPVVGPSCHNRQIAWWCCGPFQNCQSCLVVLGGYNGAGGTRPPGLAAAGSRLAGSPACAGANGRPGTPDCTTHKHHTTKRVSGGLGIQESQQPAEGGCRAGPAAAPAAPAHLQYRACLQREQRRTPSAASPQPSHIMPLPESAI